MLSLTPTLPHSEVPSPDWMMTRVRAAVPLWLSMMRTGAASGVATQYLANEDASVVGQIGSGHQSIGQLEAICAVRKIKEARVYSRTRDKLESYRVLAEALAEKAKTSGRGRGSQSSAW